MFVPDSYDEILQETQSDHHLVGSAWSFVSIVILAGWCVSILAYLV